MLRWTPLGLADEEVKKNLPVGLNVREAKRDTTIPRGGGPDGNLPVAVLAGQQIGTYRRRRKK